MHPFPEATAVNPIIRAYELLFHVVLCGPSQGPRVRRPAVARDGARRTAPSLEPAIDRAGYGRVITTAPTVMRTAPAAVPTVGTRNQ
jgi:hypothetical protein